MTPSNKPCDEEGLKDDGDGCSRSKGGGGEPQAAPSGQEVKGEVHGLEANEEEREAEASPVETDDPPEETDERVRYRKFMQVRRQFAQEEQEEHGEKVKARVHLTPDQPTAKEVEQHRDEQHINFRSWCADCVRARGTGEQHRARPDERKVPIFSFDYLIFDREDQRSDEQATFKVLVAKDHRSKSVFAHAVDHKGETDDGYAVRALVEDLKWLGYSQVILKSDNEKAILKLLRRAMVGMVLFG